MHFSQMIIYFLIFYALISLCFHSVIEFLFLLEKQKATTVSMQFTDFEFGKELNSLSKSVGKMCTFFFGLLTIPAMFPLIKMAVHYTPHQSHDHSKCNQREASSARYSSRVGAI